MAFAPLRRIFVVSVTVTVTSVPCRSFEPPLTCIVKLSVATAVTLPLAVKCIFDLPWLACVLLCPCAWPGLSASAATGAMATSAATAAPVRLVLREDTVTPGRRGVPASHAGSLVNRPPAAVCFRFALRHSGEVAGSRQDFVTRRSVQALDMSHLRPRPRTLVLRRRGPPAGRRSASRTSASVRC